MTRFEGIRGALIDAAILMRRLLDELIAEPAAVIGALILAPGYLLFQDTLFSHVAAHAPGVHGNYRAFIVPGAILVATIVGGNAGFITLRDQSDRYLQRLLTMPVSHVSIVAAPLLFGAGYAVCSAAVVLVVGAGLGVEPVTGILGVLMMLAIAALWGLAIGGFLVTVALLTNSIEMVQLADLSCFPFLFLSPLVMPRQDLSGWLRAIATVNPTTYTVDGLRALMRDGWASAQIWPAFAMGVACAASMLLLAALAARRVAVGH
jgi:ABC-2 type transport system permease protein